MITKLYLYKEMLRDILKEGSSFDVPVEDKYRLILDKQPKYGEGEVWGIYEYSQYLEAHKYWLECLKLVLVREKEVCVDTLNMIINSYLKTGITYSYNSYLTLRNKLVVVGVGSIYYEVSIVAINNTHLKLKYKGNRYLLKPTHIIDKMWFPELEEYFRKFNQSFLSLTDGIHISINLVTGELE